MQNAFSLKSKQSTEPKLPEGNERAELRGELVWGSTRWRALYDRLQKLIKARPTLLIFRLQIGESSNSTLQYHNAQAPNITAVVISAPTDPLRLEVIISTY